MSAVLLAVFNDYEAAERMRVTLFRDGFPTDRVHLTASCELGCAGLEPAGSAHAKCLQYFRTLLKREDEKELPEILAQRIDSGAANYYRASAWSRRDRTCDRASQASPPGRRGGARLQEARLGARGFEARRRGLLGSAHLARAFAQQRLHLLPPVSGYLPLTAPNLRSASMQDMPIWLPALPFAAVALTLFSLGVWTWFSGKQR